MMIRPQAFGFDGTHNFDGSLISKVGERKRGPLDINITSPGFSSNRRLNLNMGRGFPGGPPLMPIRDRRARFPQRGIGSLFDMLRNRRGFGMQRPPMFGGGYGMQQPQSNNNPFGPRPQLMYGGAFSGPPMFGGGFGFGGGGYRRMPPMFGGGSPFGPGFGGGIGGMFPGMGGGYGMRPPSFGGIGGGFNRPQPMPQPIRPMPKPIGIGNPIQPIDRPRPMPRPMPKPIQIGRPRPINRPMPIRIGEPVRPIFNKGPGSFQNNLTRIGRDGMMIY